jgi:hypothetical protein
MRFTRARGATRASVRGRAAATALLVALAVSACGSSAASDPASAGFGWLKPAPAPDGWVGARVPSGAAIAFPPDWRLTHGDPGTATAALFDARGHFLGYLNLTPRQGSETSSDWATFRVRHNAEEGDREVRFDGAGKNLRFRTGRGTCVRDAYTTSINARYEEIACLIVGRGAASVVVGAAPVDRWNAEQAVIEREISATTT